MGLEDDLNKADNPTEVQNSHDHFNACYAFTMREECSPNDYKSNDVGDRGGRTVCGVAESAHGKELLDKLWDLSYEDALAAVRPIYWNEYWLPINGPLIEDMKYSICVYDFAVNSGVNKANKYQTLYTDVDSYCDARIQMLNNAFPNGYIFNKGQENERDILPLLIARVERCRNYIPKV